MNWDQWLYWANLKLKRSNSSRRDAEIILSKITNKSRIQLLTHGNTLLNHNEIMTLKSLITRRIRGEPVAYLIGEKEFWSLKLRILPGVFIPRPDTERLVAQVLHLLPTSHLNVLDLGTGIGTIALALASERPCWDITGVDLQKQALILAQKNQNLLNFKNLKFVYGNWFKYLTRKKFDLIVSNPPYIDIHDSSLLIKDMTFEPKETLISGHSGLADLTTICQHSVRYLCQNGWLTLEHGWSQGKYVRKLFQKFGFINIHTTRDYHNYERITYGQHR